MKFKLLKSKDDFSGEHYEKSPLSALTGFFGTAGEGIVDETGKITLFVDPRYHIQAANQIKGRNVELVKMTSQFGFIDCLDDKLKEGDILSVPEKSTSYSFFLKLKDRLREVKIEAYKTKDDDFSIDTPESPVFGVDKSIAGKSTKEKVKNLSNILVTNLEEIAYLLNLRSYKTKNSAVFIGKLFIENPEKLVFFCDYDLPEIPNFVEIRPMKNYENFILSKNIEILTDFNLVSLYDYNLLKKPVPLEKNPVVQMASVKNKNEISHFTDCFKRLDDTLFAFRDRIKEGMCEFELNEIFESELKKRGAICTSFKTILAIDENSSIIHYTANSKQKFTKKGSIILLDCGGYYAGGYATDITRVFGVGEEFNPKIKEIYTAVLIAQLNVYYSPLLYTDELDNLAKKILTPYEKEGFIFPHGLGHGIGIPVHQAPPTLSNKIRTKIQNGNVFTIEPGLYKENAFGIRLENTVYLENGQKITLSHFPYEEKLIDIKMLKEKENGQLQNWQKGNKND